MDYQKQANDFLTQHDLEFRVVLVGDDCPRFCEDAEAERDMDKVTTFPRRTHIHGKHYRCTISGKERGHVAFDFWNSYAAEEENFFAFSHDQRFDNCYWDKYRIGRKYPNRARAKRRIVPTPYDLLACIQKSEPGSFSDFCADFGYAADSRKAEQTYHAVQREYAKVERFFTAEEREELAEIS